MSKKREVTLRDCIEETAGLAKSVGIVTFGLTATALAFTFSVVVYWPYSVARERVERRIHPLQLATK